MNVKSIGENSHFFFFGIDERIADNFLRDQTQITNSVVVAEETYEEFQESEKKKVPPEKRKEKGNVGKTILLHLRNGAW